jgi:serine protease Do
MDQSDKTVDPGAPKGFWWGVVGGLLGALLLVRYLPGVIPVDKRAISVQETSAIVEVAKKVSPSVVSITTEAQAFDFFRGQSTQQGAGTGIILTADGLILTNRHVIPEDATALSVFTSDGKEYKNAEVVARDSLNDIAFIRIKASGLKPAQLGDSAAVTVGQKVVAIGNALGQFQNTVTEGIVSGIGRPVLAGESDGALESLENLLQTDAAINPGNSGGPLVNLEGQVIGINTAVAGGDAQNIGFAIPINEARAAIASVKDKGRISRPYLGVRYVAITREFAQANSLKVHEGAYVTASDGEAVIAGSPAARAGLREGDIILRVGRDQINARNSLSSLIGKRRVGERVELTLLRDNKELKISATLAEAPQP